MHNVKVLYDVKMLSICERRYSKLHEFVKFVRIGLRLSDGIKGPVVVMSILAFWYYNVKFLFNSIIHVYLIRVEKLCL